MELLLLSSSTKHGTGFLEHALDAVAELLGDPKRLLFVPYAKRDHDGYVETVQAAVRPLVDYLTSDEGQAMVASIGFIPIR